MTSRITRWADLARRARSRRENVKKDPGGRPRRFSFSQSADDR
jgi:hypothetical protein